MMFFSNLYKYDNTMFLICDQNIQIMINRERFEDEFK